MKHRNLWLTCVVLSVVFAASAIVQSAYHDVWYDLLWPRLWLMDLVEFLLLPLWLVSTAFAFILFPAPRKRLWWLLLPSPWVFLRLIEFLLTIFAWSTHGFAP